MLALGLACASSGCRQNVYHELYAEQNAREIRALEDRIYEYDAEYRTLEHQLLAVESENEQLRRKLNGIEDKPKLFGGNRSSETNKTPRNAPSAPQPIPIDESWELPSVLVPTPTDSGKKAVSPEDIPKPKTNDGGAKSGGLSDELPAPTPNKGLQEPKQIPSNDTPLPNLPILPGADPTPSNNNASPPNNPPLFPGGQQQPPAQPLFNPRFQPPTAPGGTAPGSNAPGDRDRADANRSRISVPEVDEQVKQASALVATSSQPMAKDRRITGIFFHPSLCRGINLDDSPEDDGVYLVIQPQNATGDFVADPGEVTIIAVDPSRPKEQERIARWTYGKEELAKLAHPQGSSQGYHLPLRWQSDTPRGDHVQIYVRYQLPDGKTLVAERKLMLHARDSIQSVWTPRAK